MAATVIVLQWTQPYRRFLSQCCNAVGFTIVKLPQRKQLGFRGILLISLLLIEYEKIHTVHSNELAKGYRLIPVSF